jgi:hypothetical protein
VMLQSSFFVSLYAPGPVAPEEYIMQDLFTSKAKIAALTKGAPLSGFHTELDVSQTEDGGLLGRAVVDIQAEVRVGLDKTKLSKELKNAAPWKNCKVEKRAVPIEGSHVEDAEAVGAAIVA